MGPVTAAAIVFALALAIAAALVLQRLRRSSPAETPTYWLPEASAFVTSRLSEAARGRLTPADVRAILGWGLDYHQVVAPRDEGHRPVVGSGDAMDYILEKGAASGSAYDPFDVAEVLAAETEYLVEIGAVGPPVEDEKS